MKGIGGECRVVQKILKIYPKGKILAFSVMVWVTVSGSNFPTH